MSFLLSMIGLIVLIKLTSKFLIYLGDILKQKGDDLINKSKMLQRPHFEPEPKKDTYMDKVRKEIEELTKIGP